MPRMPDTAHREVRDATDADADGIVAVARAHGFDGSDTAVDPDYRAFIANHGRFVVSDVGGRIVGFGGAIDVTRARLVTDLFLLDSHQGRGLGGSMLSTLLDGFPNRMTFSSGHERALPSYVRHGMHPAWTLEYWCGRRPGSVTTDSDPAVVEVPSDRWRGDRPDLAEHWARAGGRLLHLGEPEAAQGWAIVVPPGSRTRPWEITRIVSTSPVAATRAALSTVPAGADVLVCAREGSGAATVLAQLGFEVTDRDVFCASDGVTIDANVAALHPGLG